MTQSFDESVTSYVERLKSAAEVCDFLVTCPKCNTDVSYSDHNVRDTFFVGIYNQSMLESICTHFKKKVPNLEEIVAEAKNIETARLTASKAPDARVAAVSTYKQQARAENRANFNKKRAECRECGSADRHAKDCKKLRFHCRRCNRWHNKEDGCKTKDAPPPAAPATASTNQISCGATEDDFDGFIFQLATNDDNAVPRLSVQLSMNKPDSYALAVRNKQITVDALADTGCTISVINEAVFREMGGNIDHLAKCSTRLHAANNTALDVLGET